MSLLSGVFLIAMRVKTVSRLHSLSRNSELSCFRLELSKVGLQILHVGFLDRSAHCAFNGSAKKVTVFVSSMFSQVAQGYYRGAFYVLRAVCQSGLGRH